jgi:hypothetical protein
MRRRCKKTRKFLWQMLIFNDKPFLKLFSIFKVRSLPFFEAFITWRIKICIFWRKFWSLIITISKKGVQLYKKMANKLFISNFKFYAYCIWSILTLNIASIQFRLWLLIECEDPPRGVWGMSPNLINFFSSFLWLSWTDPGVTTVVAEGLRKYPCC